MLIYLCQHLAMMQANNNQYMRMNTIEIRRLAVLSQKEGEQSQALAQASRMDAHDMKKLAYLTMIHNTCSQIRCGK